MSGHTKGKWALRRSAGGAVIVAGPMVEYANGATQSQVAMTVGAGWMAEGEFVANAERIVLCVNAHDALVDTLHDMLEGYPPHAYAETRALLDEIAEGVVS